MEHAITSGELWTAIIGGGFAIVAAILSVQYTWHRSNKKQASEWIQTVEFVLKEYLPHSHSDPPGAVLKQENIHYPKSSLKGS
jgi:hypothetical protein